MNMNFKILPIAAIALGLAACNSGSNVTLPPQPPVGPSGTPLQYTQIERLSRPAIKEVFERFVDHQVSNATEPYDTVNDPLFAQIKSFQNTVRPPSAALGTDYGTALQGVLYPDEYAVDLSQTAGAAFLGYETTAGHAGFGGRNPNDDVIGTELSVIFGNTLATLKLQPEDNEENNCLSAQNIKQNPTQATTGTFPYLAPAH